MIMVVATVPCIRVEVGFVLGAYLDQPTLQMFAESLFDRIVVGLVLVVTCECLLEKTDHVIYWIHYHREQQQRNNRGL